MCELAFITEIQDLQRKIPITVKLTACEQATWLKNGNRFQIESKKNVLIIIIIIIIIISVSLRTMVIRHFFAKKKTGPMFWNKDPAQVMKLIQIRKNLLQGNVRHDFREEKEHLMKNGKTSTWYFWNQSLLNKLLFVQYVVNKLTKLNRMLCSDIIQRMNRKHK
jgi:hypothetical protein